MCGRQYTYKFAGKLLRMVPKIRSDTKGAVFPVEAHLMETKVFVILLLSSHPLKNML